MTYTTRVTISVIVAMLLVTNSIIAFNHNQTMKWLWLVVALFSIINVIYFSGRKQGKNN